ncbi:hypothetical protein ACIP96_27125 [Streptomyces nigra]|uniref:hypothetical protein n=1 Tax=Streptomyces nigra TaxID=1827580 RepID=UPI0038202535
MVVTLPVALSICGAEAPVARPFPPPVASPHMTEFRVPRSPPHESRKDRQDRFCVYSTSRAARHTSLIAAVRAIHNRGELLAGKN